MPLITEEEITNEVRLMKAAVMWPHRPILPVKQRRSDSGVPKLGILFEDKPTVYIEVDWYGPLGKEVLDKAEKEIFESFRELVLAGWVGD